MPTAVPSSRCPGCPCSPSRPWGLLSQASPCRQPQLTVKAQGRARARERPGCGDQAAGPGAVVGGVSMIRQPGVAIHPLGAFLTFPLISLQQSRIQDGTSLQGHLEAGRWRPREGTDVSEVAQQAHTGAKHKAWAFDLPAREASSPSLQLAASVRRTWAPGRNQELGAEPRSHFPLPSLSFPFRKWPVGSPGRPTSFCSAHGGGGPVGKGICGLSAL